MASTAVFKRVPVVANGVRVFEAVKTYRPGSPRVMNTVYQPTDIGRALDSCVQKVEFLGVDTLKGVSVNSGLSVKGPADPYLMQHVRDISKTFFK